MIKKIKKEDHRIVERIKDISFADLSDEELLNYSNQLKTRAYSNIKESDDTSIQNEDLMVESYALVFESCKRNLGITPFDVQLLGAISLHKNMIIQMQTGEGKTLCAVFAVFLKVLTGKKVHVLTFNNYLAKRDADWMRPIYESLGISVGYINSDMNLSQRKSAYGCDVTYVTAKEAGFDYLRDCLVYDVKDKVHQGFDCAIVDEADSILIDEAGIPLVIAGKTEECENESLSVTKFIKELNPETDYEIDDYGRNVFFTDIGVNKIEEYFHISNLYDDENINLLTRLNSALHAESLFKKNVHYIIKDEKVQLIDESTGRIAANRHWPDGLQEAVEAKEGFDRSSKGMILGNITILNFLELYKEKAGMTGTALSSSEEFAEIYGFDVIEIPPNKNSIRIDYKDKVYRSVPEKNKAVMNEIKEIHATGRPILIGTGSIEESEEISNALENEGIKCTVLNAKNDEAEAELIANAGRLNAVTVSTNMAGRGVDIKLGGGEPKEAEKVNNLGGLCIIATGKNESVRIDNQLRGRAGRQGDAGSSQFFVSIRDDIMTRFGITESLESSSAKLKYDEMGRITNKNIDYHIAHIQRVIEGQNHEIRTTLNKYAYMLEEQRIINQEKRESLLSDQNPDVLLDNIQGWQNLITDIEAKVEKSEVKNTLKQIQLYELDSGWVDFLEYVNYIREGIHLVSLGREDPLYHYHLQIIEAFDNVNEEVNESIFKEIEKFAQQGEKYRSKKIADVTTPTATWTYIISDNEFKNRIRKSKYNKNKVHFVTMKGIIDWPKQLMDRIRKK